MCVCLLNFVSLDQIVKGCWRWFVQRTIEKAAITNVRILCKWQHCVWLWITHRALLDVVFPCPQTSHLSVCLWFRARMWVTQWCFKELHNMWSVRCWQHECSVRSHCTSCCAVGLHIHTRHYVVTIHSDFTKAEVATLGKTLWKRTVIGNVARSSDFISQWEGAGPEVLPGPLAARDQSLADRHRASCAQGHCGY